MPGKSKKGGGLESSPVYKKIKPSGFKMKYKHSAFPFKSSPAKYNTQYTPPQSPDVSSTGSTGSGNYDLTENPYAAGPSTWIGGAEAFEHKAKKEAWEKGGGAAGSAIQDLDRRVTNLGG